MVWRRNMDHGAAADPNDLVSYWNDIKTVQISGITAAALQHYNNAAKCKLYRFRCRMDCKHGVVMYSNKKQSLQEIREKVADLGKTKNRYFPYQKLFKKWMKKSQNWAPTTAPEIEPKVGENLIKNGGKIEPKSLEKLNQFSKTWSQNGGRKTGPILGPSFRFQSLFRKGNTKSDPKKVHFCDPDFGPRNWSKKWKKMIFFWKKFAQKLQTFLCKIWLLWP